MSSRPLSSPLSLVILGLLAEQPLHPYGMRVIMGQRGHDRIVGRSPASLYDAAKRLAVAGLIEVHAAEQDDHRPERTVYRLTTAGLAAMQDWVRHALADPERAGQFTAALSFMYVLTRNEAVELLGARRVALDALTHAGDAALTSLAAGVPPIFLSEGRYTNALLRAEHDWLATFTTQLCNGDLAWPRPKPSPRKPS